MNRSIARLLMLVFALSAASGQVSYFGKNKVQTRDYAFQSLETEHFRILFYPGGEVLADFAARSAEAYYEEATRDLGIELPEKTPLLVYLSPTQFAETNVITDIIEEGVGGFSELLRNRIVIPFDGSYNNLHHVIGHELTHIFQFQMFFRSRLAALLGAVDEFRIPLWVTEGLAEYQSGWVNQTTDAFMRDLVLNNRLVPLQSLSDDMGYLVYREGESFYRFVEERYGRKKVYEFLHVLRTRRSLDAAFGAAFGLSIERLSADWERWLRVKYWPQVVKVSRFDELAERLTDHVRDGSVYNTAPAISPSGTKIAMISDRSEYADLYVISATDGRVLRRLVRGGASGGFEGLHLLRPGTAWSPDERLLAVVTTTEGRDNITLIEHPGGKVRRRIHSGLDAVCSPRFSSDGGRLVFVGLKNGFSDVYSVSVGGVEPERLTYDMYDDRDPACSGDGAIVAFVSDRPEQGEEWRPGQYALWVRMSTGETRRLTDRVEQLFSPCFTADDSFIIYGVGGDVGSICVYSMSEARVVRRADLLGEASHLTLSRDDRKLSFSYYENVGWDVALMLDPLERIPEETAVPPPLSRDTIRYANSGLDFGRVRPLPFTLALDYAIGAASYVSGSYSGLSGTVAVAFSDLLGNHRFEVYTDLYGDILNSDLYLGYWLLPYRVDYGFALFQQRQYPYYISNWALVEEVLRGGSALGSYPFDKFTRVELGTTGYVGHQDTWRYVGTGWYQRGAGNEFISYLSPALVFDNTYWTYEGPARGIRARLAADIGLFGARRFWEPHFDMRGYARLGRRYVLAGRLAGTASLGRDAGLYALGGEYVRGYGWGEFYSDAGPALTLGSVELRYPFIERLKLGFPLPLELGGIRGVAFADAGLVLRDSLRMWDAAGSRLGDLKVGVGLGLRVQISYFALKFDWAKPLSATDDKSWKFTFGIGTDF